MTEREKGEKVISFHDFKLLVNSTDWERSQKVEIVDRLLVERWEGKLVYVPCVVGWGIKFNKNKLDGVEIIYVEDWSYIADWSCFPNDSDSFAANPLSWFIDGVRVVHDDGEEVNILDLADLLPKEFTTIDYSEFIPGKKIKSSS